MRRIHSDMHPKAKAVDEDKVGPLGGMVLMTIAEMAPVSLHQLGAQLARDKAQMTRVVQMLERKQLLHRDQSAEDGRVSFISLTRRGEQTVRRFQTAMAEVVDQLVGDIDGNEIAGFSRVLKTLLSAPSVAPGD